MTDDNTIDTMLRSIEATWKELRQTKQRRLDEEQRFHNAYLEESPRRQPSQAHTYLHEEAHNDPSITSKDIDGVEDITINITRIGTQYDVETPTRLHGEETTRRQRHARIQRHQRRTRELTDELKQYRQDTSKLKPDTGRLTRVRLTERPTQTTRVPSPRGSQASAIPDDTTTSPARPGQPTTKPTGNDEYQPCTVPPIQPDERRPNAEKPVVTTTSIEASPPNHPKQL